MLYQVQNRTVLPELVFPSISREDHELVAITLTARYRLPTPGRFHDTVLEPAPIQSPAPLAEVWLAEPAQSSLLWDGQGVYVRPGTDIHVYGHACALAGERVSALLVTVRVGPCSKRIRVIGERRFVRSAGELHISPPVAFERIPLIWERAYGGTTPDGRRVASNPIGVGIFDNRRSAEGARLPNLLPVDADMRDWRDVIAAVGFAAVPRDWYPRATFAGTYDAAWLERRSPLWPADLDLRLFCAAAPGLCASPWLRGGEAVVIEGMSPDGTWAFQLPTRRFWAEFEDARQGFVLDVVRIDTDANELALVWRTAVARSRTRQLEITVHEALPWEMVA